MVKNLLNTVHLFPSTACCSMCIITVYTPSEGTTFITLENLADYVMSWTCRRQIQGTITKESHLWTKFYFILLGEETACNNKGFPQPLPIQQNQYFWRSNICTYSIVFNEGTITLHTHMQYFLWEATLTSQDALTMSTVFPHSYPFNRGEKNKATQSVHYFLVPESKTDLLGRKSIYNKLLPNQCLRISPYSLHYAQHSSV